MTGNEPEGPETVFRLLTVAPVSGLLGGWAEDRPDGKCQLHVEKIDAIGVAEITDYIKGRPAGSAMEVVGLILRGGSWSICEEDTSFAGTFREGDDPYLHTDWLRCEYSDRLVRPDGSPVHGPEAQP